MKSFVCGKKYKFKRDFQYNQPYPLKSGLIPKGAVVTFDCPNLGFARFCLEDSELIKKLGAVYISLKPKIAFNILEEKR